MLLRFTSCALYRIKVKVFLPLCLKQAAQCGMQGWPWPWQSSSGVVLWHYWGNTLQYCSSCQYWSKILQYGVILSFASYVATLLSERWTRRILEWNIRGPRKPGRPAYTWGTALQKYCIWTGGGNWIVEAAAYDHWMRSKQDFVFFTLYTSWSGKILHFACALKNCLWAGKLWLWLYLLKLPAPPCAALLDMSLTATVFTNVSDAFCPGTPIGVTNWNFIIIYKRFRKSNTFFAERNILCNKAVYLVRGVIFFNRIVTPCGMLCGGHRRVY